MIRYTTSLDGIRAEALGGFFVGWPKPPSPQTHLRVLEASAHVVLAVDDAAGRVVGFINAISDGVLAAYIPLLEVLPAYRGRGIGAELTRRMREELGELYMIDLVCDESMLPFYARFGFSRAAAAAIRNYGSQCGKDAEP